jgi:cation:H+ antiporter
MLEYILFVLGFAFLLKGADYLIRGSSALAEKFCVPKLLVGLTIVSFGTSMPELIVNIMASIEGAGDIALGTIIGSNLSNILLILGITAILYPPKIQHSTVWKEIPFSLLAVVVLFILANDFLIDGVSTFDLTRTDGLILLSFFAIFMYYLVGMFKNNNNTKKVQKNVVKEKNGKIALMIVLGLIGLYFGGRWIVDGAVFIAKNFGLSEFLISATIISLGTSLPELITSITAAMKKNVDIAVGNIVGSNIFNIFLVLGISSTINPLPIPSFINPDIIFLTLITALLFAFMFVQNKHKLDRNQATLFILLYLGYVAFVIMRG